MAFPENLFRHLKALFKENDAIRIQNELEQYLVNLKHKDKPPIEKPWHKCLHLYTVYPEGIIYNKKISHFKNLIPHLQFIKNLGFNAMHILPFLQSPLVDHGYDIKDFYKVRSDLGTMKDVLDLVEHAKKTGIRLFMDLVLNHISEEHEWFEKAQAGDEYYRDFFITLKNEPKFIRSFKQNAAVWAEYIVNNKPVAINIPFPEHTGEIPHWRQGKDDYWYYHTYYPEQLDLNWFNPNVFIEIAKIAIHWCRFGFNFRLDAIPFVGKKAYKSIDTPNNRTHLILAALSTIVKRVHPECILLVETFERLHTVKAYFGTNRKVQSDLAYNFHLSTNTWVSIVKKNVDYIWHKLIVQDNIPAHAEWLNFLRNHDELSLAHLRDRDVEHVRKELVHFGKDFRTGLGISGRTFALLGKKRDRFFMAYFLLASFPGGLMLPYGDEIAHKNVPLSKLPLIQRKDTRNINRGTIKADEIMSKKGQKFLHIISEILIHRCKLIPYLMVWPTRLDSPKEIFAARYGLDTSDLIVLVNLSDKKMKVPLDMKLTRNFFHINQVKLGDKFVELGAYAGIWLLKNTLLRK